MGTKKICILLILLFIFFHENCIAQSKKMQAHFADLLSRILIVQVEEENPKVIEKLKTENHSNYIDQYLKDIRQYNENMKQVVELYWQVNDSIEFMTFNEYMAIPTGDRKKYLVLRCVTQSLKVTGRAVNQSEHTVEVTEWVSKDYIDWSVKNLDSKKQKSYSIVMEYVPLDEYKIDRVENGGAHWVSNIYSSKGNLVYVMLRIRHEIDFVLHPPNRSEYRGNGHTDSLYPSLKVKVLLISRSEVDPSLDENKVKEIYPYPFSIVPNEKFENSIITCNSDTVLLHNSQLIFDWKGNKEAVGIMNPYMWTPFADDTDTFSPWTAKGFEVLRNAAEGKYLKKK